MRCESPGSQTRIMSGQLAIASNAMARAGLTRHETSDVRRKPKRLLLTAGGRSENGCEGHAISDRRVYERRPSCHAPDDSARLGHR